MTASLVPACLVAFSALALQAMPAHACTGVRAGRSVDVQSEVWRTAVAELLRASATEGAPWSCTGGTVDLWVHDPPIDLKGAPGAAPAQTATLTVIDATGRSVSREVSSPEDVLPLGEALLSKPEVMPAAPRPPPSGSAPTPDHSETPRLASNPKSPKLPYAVLGAAIAPRYAGRSDIVWGGVTAIAQFPFSAGPAGPWLAGAWARYDGPSASLGQHELHLDEIVIGTSIAKSFVISPIELRLAARPSVAIVRQSFGRDHEDVTRVDGRMGFEANVVVPVASPVRGVIGLDGEFSPREMSEEDRPPRSDIPDWMNTRFPAYTLGISLGVEVAIR